MYEIDCNNDHNGAYVKLKMTRRDVLIISNALDVYNDHFNDMDYVKQLRSEFLNLDQHLFEMENDSND